MNKTITVKMNENILRKAKFFAIEHHMSLSQWISRLIKNCISKQHTYQKSKKEALRHLLKGYHVGEKLFTREQIHE